MVRYIKNFLYELKAKYLKFFIKSKFNIFLKNNVVILNKDESIDYLIKSKTNLSRFGDGEFNLLLKKSDPGFQNMNDLLSDKLKMVLNSNLNNLVIGIPYSLVNLDENTVVSTCFWGDYYKENHKSLLPFLNRRSKYLDAALTRLYIPTLNRSSALKRFNKMKGIWKGRDILFLEGEYSRVGVGNDLFDSVKSIKRIICPSKNAFDKLEIIIEEVKKVADNKLVICCLGPTATILAYELAKENIWCLDLGHIDIEYLWALEGNGRKPIKGRLLNEVNGNSDLDIKDKDKYEDSILKRII